MQHKWSNILTLLLALTSRECCGTPSCSKIHHLLLTQVLWFLRFVSKAGAGSRGGGDRQFCYVNGRPVDLPKVCSQFDLDHIACTLPHSRSHLLSRSLTHTKNDLLTQSVIDSVTHSFTHALTSSLTHSINQKCAPGLEPGIQKIYALLPQRIGSATLASSGQGRPDIHGHHAQP